MKKEVQKWRSSIEDITMEEAVSEFFDENWDPHSWEDTEANIDSYIEEFPEISDKEADLLKVEIKKEFNERVNELRQKEIAKLKDRDSILEWIDMNEDNYWQDEGEVGYMLSKEEILDLIIQNGNK